MPIHGIHGSFGNMYVNFDIEYPNKLDQNIVKQLEKILPEEGTTSEDGAQKGKENMEVDG